MDIIRQNKIIIIIGVVIIAILTWYLLSSSSKQNTALLSTVSTSNTKHVDDKQLLKILNNLKAIHLDGRIFESTAYLNLVDFSRDIVPEPIGREDPFAPVTDTQVTVTGGGDQSSDILVQ